MIFLIGLYKELAELYASQGFTLYMVGGCVRDFLLGHEFFDMDLVTDATPNQQKAFLESADYTFEKYGSIKLIYKNTKFDITTLRKENEYLDSRHPNHIEFTNKLDGDVIRRDLTINALYMDKDLKIYDFVSGEKDLSNRIIRMIGEPLKRIKEDPLRIVRIYRFKFDLDFVIEKELEQIINHNFHLLAKLNIDKIKEEIRKADHKNQLIDFLSTHVDTLK